MLICRACKEEEGRGKCLFNQSKNHVLFHSRGCIKFDSQQSLLCSAGTRTAVAGEILGQEEGALAVLS